MAGIKEVKPEVAKEIVADAKEVVKTEAGKVEEAPVDETITTQYQKLSGTTLTGQVIDLSQFNKPKKKKEEVSVAASLANSAAQDERNSRQGAHYNTPHDSPDNKEDFTIHSAEEARRAIIWGEILQRKY